MSSPESDNENELMFPFQGKMYPVRPYAYDPLKKDYPDKEAEEDSDDSGDMTPSSDESDGLWGYSISDASHDSEDDKCIYLDYNATTPLEPKVVKAISRALKKAWGNPSSSNYEGRHAKMIIGAARTRVAAMIGGRHGDIIFTSGGTEANNLVIHTAVEHFKKTFPEASSLSSPQAKIPRPHVVTSNLEHDSIILPLEHKAKDIIDVTHVPASKLTGMVEVSDVIAAIRPTTCLVTIMHANNETGVIQPIEEICRQVKALKRDPAHEVPRILLHTDAAQTIGKIGVNVTSLGVDYLTIVGHKFYGPRIGALYVRGPGSETPLYPMLFGGGQERNFRPGTENTGMIAGLGMAAYLVTENLEKYESHMRLVRDYLEEKLKEKFPDRVHFNGRFEGSHRIPNTCNVSITGKNHQGTKVLSKCQTLQASVGAACHSHEGNKPSHILTAIGVPDDIAINALRLSVGRQTTKEDIDEVVDDLRLSVRQLDWMTPSAT